jgi:hypothetical protein
VDWVNLIITVPQWGNFEVGKYSGSKMETRDAILTDFRYGRLDVGKYS